MRVAGTCVVLQPREPPRAFTCSMETLTAAVVAAVQRAQERVAAERAKAASAVLSTVPASSTACGGQDSCQNSAQRAPLAKKSASAGHSTETPGGLSAAQIRAIQSRELTPEDYDLLLRLDEAVAKRNLLRPEDAEALIHRLVDAEDEATCTICCCDLERGETVVILPCGHSFHSDCGTRWLTQCADGCKPKVVERERCTRCV